EDPFFKYCMGEALDLAFFSMLQGMDFVDEKLKEFAPKTKGLTDDPELMLKPESYRLVLYVLAHWKIRVQVMRLKAFAPGSSREELRKQGRDLWDIVNYMVTKVDEADMDKEKRKKAKERIRLIKDEWKLQEPLGDERMPGQGRRGRDREPDMDGGKNE
ncbi:MAG: hypothetical protein JXR97_02475, partial [Planctomycetes bacterium]|nr:hypothetical protein [Planctomycetota bacterium]